MGTVVLNQVIQWSQARKHIMLTIVYAYWVVTRFSLFQEKEKQCRVHALSSLHHPIRKDRKIVRATIVVTVMGRPSASLS